MFYLFSTLRKTNFICRWGDVQIKTGSDGIEYLELQERQTKTRTGTNISDVREITPKIYATPEDKERCPLNYTNFMPEKDRWTFVNRTIHFTLHAALALKKLIMKTGS